MSTSAPLVVMSFNRAKYLRPVLESLASNGTGEREVHLFQDGAVSPRTRTRFAKDAEIAASIAAFRDVFPQGTVHAADGNLGIAMNFRRAERYVFLERGFDLGYFFEDDLVLSPHYLPMMDRVADWAADKPKVAYFAAYGDQHADAAVQAKRHRMMIPLGHNWGFAIKREPWLKMNAFLDQHYYPHIEDIDYVQRRIRKAQIFDSLKPLGMLPSIISQDAMKGIAMYALGCCKAKTVACFASYIGAEGVHFNEERFLAKGFGNTAIYPEPIDLRFPGDAELDVWIEKARENYRKLWRAYFEPAPGEPTHEDIRQASRQAALKKG